jgi:hypothetical protein
MQRLDSKKNQLEKEGRVARFFLLQNTKTGKLYQIAINYTKLP